VYGEHQRLLTCVSRFGVPRIGHAALRRLRLTIPVATVPTITAAMVASTSHEVSRIFGKGCEGDPTEGGGGLTCPGTGVGVGLGLEEGVRVCVGDGLGVRDTDAAAEEDRGDGTGPATDVRRGVALLEEVGSGDLVVVFVGTGEGESVGVGIGEGEPVGEGDGEGLSVGVGVALGESEVCASTRNSTTRIMPQASRPGSRSLLHRFARCPHVEVSLSRAIVQNVQLT
jgi:hypothetical protein